MDGVGDDSEYRGVLVDIGVHQDGLVHTSEMSDKYVKDPADVVKVHQRVTVIELDVDAKRRRIGLTMRGHAGLGLRLQTEPRP